MPGYVRFLNELTRLAGGPAACGLLRSLPDPQGAPERWTRLPSDRPPCELGRTAAYNEAGRPAPRTSVQNRDRETALLLESAGAAQPAVIRSGCTQRAGVSKSIKTSDVWRQMRQSVSARGCVRVCVCLCFLRRSVYMTAEPCTWLGDWKATAAVECS